MHRPTVGILAFVLLAIGAAMLFMSGDGGSWQSAGASCVRVGAILGVLWLALPDMNRPVSRWILAAILIGIFLVAKRPQLIVLALVLLVGVAILRPRVKRFAEPPRR